MVFGVGRWIVFLDQGDQIDLRRPWLEVEHAVVVRIEILAVRSRESLHQQVRDVIIVLEVQARDQIGRAQREGVFGGDEVARGWDRRPTEVGDVFDHAACACGAVPDHQVGQPVERSTRRTGEFEVLIGIRAGLVDADFADGHLWRWFGRGRRRRTAERLPGVDRAERTRRGSAPDEVLVEGACAR